MSTAPPANSVVTSDTPTVKSGVSGGIRITVSIIVAIVLGIFILTWDAKFIPHEGFPDWLGPIIFIPLIATVLAFGSTCMIQQLSCGKVQWLVQLQRVAIVPVPFILMTGFLALIPNMRWPIEGLIQSGSPSLRRGLSSAFYTFWMGMYCQGLLNGVAQLCPK